jgi:3D (Asp-Asp-Asp) domain-containing protein/peptidoglycan hydrolase CwlO-like protein
MGALALAALLISPPAQADDPAVLRTAAEQLRAENDGIDARSQTALLELYSLERRLARAEQRVAALQARRATAEREEASAQHRLRIARSDAAEAERRLGLRLNELYVQGEVDPIAVLLAAESLEDALSAYDGLTRLADQDSSILDRLRDARRELRDSLREASERRAELDHVLREAEREQAALAAARAQRAGYLAGLAGQRSLNADRIASLTAQAEHASEETPAPASPSPTPATPQPPPPPSGTSHLTMDVVAYCGEGTTASGLPVGWGIVAVDPAVIPLGTKLYVPGYGNGVAADTGSAIKGMIIDVWFPTCAQARAWGRKRLTITVFWQ